MSYGQVRAANRWTDVKPARFSFIVCVLQSKRGMCRREEDQIDNAPSNTTIQEWHGRKQKTQRQRWRIAAWVGDNINQDLSPGHRS